MSVLDGIKETVYQVVKSWPPEPLPLAERFDDPLAGRVEWSFIRGGFSGRRLLRGENDIWRYGGWGWLAQIFFGTLVGGAILYFFSDVVLSKMAGEAPSRVLLFLALPLLMLVFLLFSGFRSLQFHSRAIVFDPYVREVCIGHHLKIGYGNIYALQLIERVRKTKNGNHYTYQINLVLQDLSRILLMNYGSPFPARSDARQIAELMRLPPGRIWDIAGGG